MNFSMLKQAQQLKSELEKAQKELSNTIVEADSGKGAVKVSIDGQQKILSIKIAKTAVKRRVISSETESQTVFLKSVCLIDLFSKNIFLISLQSREMFIV